MNVNPPYGGFLVSREVKTDLMKRAVLLKKKGAAVVTIESESILLAVWDEFHGQGIWQSGDQSVVVYDAELSNEPDLKRQLGIEATQSVDVGELLWRLYESYGSDMLDRVRGCFGFSIWDNRKKCLLIVTDPFGLRTVVYKKSPHIFVAASRIKHLLWGNYSDKAINSDAVFHYMLFQAICTPLTIYDDILKLEPGNGFFVDQKGAKRFEYYDIEYHTNVSKTELDWMKLIPKELEKAISNSTQSLPDEKVGCFLSGGTDSSSIVGIYTKLMGKPAKTFSIGFDEKGYNELDYAQIAVNQYQSIKNEYYVTPDDVLFLMEFLPQIYDEPFGNASVIPAFFCAKSAKESGMDFLLGGDGGDEIFGGNERYVRNLVFEKYFDLPGLFRKSILEPMLSIMPSSGLFYKAKRYVRRAKIRNPERFYSYSFLIEKELSEILSRDFVSSVNPDAFMAIARQHYNKVSYAHVTDRLLYLDMKFTITDNDIRKVTQMAESVGMRVRYPFLDRDFVDFAAKIPADLKVKWGKGRYIFKKSMEGILPEEIIHKSKHGMGLPVDPWFKKDKRLKAFLADNLAYGQPEILNFVKKEFIENLFKQHKTADTPLYGNTLWVYLILELWLKNRIKMR